MNKAIITVVGQDTVGIIARVCTYLSDHKVNVLDISQTIIDGFFNMMMIVDYSGADNEFGVIVVLYTCCRKYNKTTGTQV